MINFFNQQAFTLYIASNSASRKKLLEQAGIIFEVIEHDADESTVQQDQPFCNIVQQTAQLKMDHAKISDGNYQGEIRFILTADTLGLTKQDRVLCKPFNRKDAISMLGDARGGTLTITAFCLRKIEWKYGYWHLVQEVADFDQADSIFDVPDVCMDFYLDSIDFLSVSGAISIEGVGGQFLKFVQGSYESIIGLPMYKLRKHLYDMGFYDKVL